VHSYLRKSVHCYLPFTPTHSPPYKNTKQSQTTKQIISISYKQMSITTGFITNLYCQDLLFIIFGNTNVAAIVFRFDVIIKSSKKVSVLQLKLL